MTSCATLTKPVVDWRRLAINTYRQVVRSPPQMHESFDSHSADYWGGLEVVVMESVFRQVGDLDRVKQAIDEYLDDWEQGEFDDDFTPLYRRLGCRSVKSSTGGRLESFKHKQTQTA